MQLNYSTRLIDINLKSINIYIIDLIEHRFMQILRLAEQFKSIRNL